MVELYHRYRPSSFKEVVGQGDAVRVLSELGKQKDMPHAILFTGPSGTGKTTLARILRHKLKCSDIDFIEMNSASFRGIDMVRDISSKVGSAPLGGKTRVWLIDEAHQLTSAGQDAFLKLLEDTPEHVYFFLATTDPQKLKKTIITRCTEIKCKALSVGELKSLVAHVLKQEGKELDVDVLNKMVEVADGSARKVMVLLHAVIGLDDSEKQMEAIESVDLKGQAIEIARALINPNTEWSKMAIILKKVDDEPESIRWLVLAYCRSVMLGNNKKVIPRAALVIEEFRENFFDSKGAGLAISCWNIIAEKS